MPYLIHWTAHALEDLARLHAALAESDAWAAQRAVEAIEAATRILRDFPRAGRLAWELGTEQRELLIPFGASGYAAFYELCGDTVVVLALKHQREAGYPA